MTISDYKELLLSHQPCDIGLAAFNECKCRKDVFELLASPVAVDYFLKSVADGWGPSADDFERVFRPYINGGHTVINKIGDRKMRSQVWCRADDIIVPSSVRWIILIGCRGEVVIPEWQVAKVFLDANSSVRLHCEPNSLVYVVNYGGEIRDVEGECKINRL